MARIAKKRKTTNKRLVMTKKLAKAPKSFDMDLVGYIPTSVLKTLRYNSFDHSQIREISFAYRDHLNVDTYMNKAFNMHQMACIRKGELLGLDISVYAKEYYSARQMIKLRKCLEFGKDTSWLESSTLHPKQMEEILLGLISGVDVSLYADEQNSVEAMRQARQTLEARLTLALEPQPETLVNLYGESVEEVPVNAVKRVDFRPNDGVVEKTHISAWKKSNLGGSVLECSQHFSMKVEDVYDVWFKDEEWDITHYAVLGAEMPLVKRCAFETGLSVETVLRFWKMKSTKSPVVKTVKHWKALFIKYTKSQIVRDIVEWRLHNKSGSKSGCVQAGHGVKSVRKYWNLV